MESPTSFFVLLKDEIVIDEKGVASIRPSLHGHTFPTREAAEKHASQNPLSLITTGDIHVHRDMIAKLHWHVKEYQL